jgi:hypothetical protein
MKTVLGAMAAIVMTAGTAAAAEQQPGTVVIPPVDHKVEAGVRVGALTGGEMTPKGFLVTRANPAPIVTLDAHYVVHPFFTLGTYANFAPLSVERFMRTEVVGDGSGLLVSAGAYAKARFQVSESVLLRVGLAMGPNLLSMSGKSQGSDYSMGAAGLNMALVGEAVYRLSERAALGAQLGFLSQVSGSAKVEGSDKSADFAFPPMFFLSVGPEIWL